LVGAAAFLRPPQDRPRASNASMTSPCRGKNRSTPIALNAPLPHRRERLSNWLALLALLAIGIL
jgi:hypothetical protein